MARDLQQADRRRRGGLKKWLKRLAVVLALLVLIGVALPFGCVGNRQFNTAPEDYLRTFTTDQGLPYAVAVVEFDDQGEPWDLRQLEEAVEQIRRLNRSSEHGVVLFQFAPWFVFRPSSLDLIATCAKRLPGDRIAARPRSRRSFWPRNSWAWSWRRISR